MLFADEFTTGLVFMGRILALLLGGLSAVLLVILGILILVLMADAIFDSVTTAMARHWKKANREPRSRLGKIIARSRDGKASV